MVAPELLDPALGSLRKKARLGFRARQWITVFGARKSMKQRCASSLQPSLRARPGGFAHVFYCDISALAAHNSPCTTLKVMRSHEAILCSLRPRLEQSQFGLICWLAAAVIGLL